MRINFITFPMGGLLSSIYYNSQALSAQSAALQTTGKNLANVSSPGYARQRANLATSPTLGVQVASVQSLRDRYLDAQVVSEGSVTSMLQAKYDAMSRAQSGLGESINRATAAGSVGDTASNTGINGALTSFFNAAQSFSANPTSAAQKQVLMQSAGTLSQAINSADANLASEQQAETDRVSGDVTDAQGLLKDIASLNQQISTSEAGSPGSAVDLRDARQAKIESLAQKMNIEVKPSADHPSELQISARDNYGNSVPLVDKSTVVGALSFDGQNISASNNGNSVALNVSGGSIAGGLQARDGTIAGLRANLKTMAGQLTSAVNSAYNPGGTGANFFAASPAGGKLLDIDPATTAETLHAGSSGDAGANDLALAMANVGTKAFSTSGGDAVNGTLGGYYSGVVSNFGAQLSGVSAQITDQGLVSQQISSQRDSVSGVSIDEETTNLLQYQRAYQASSKVISVINTMMDDVLNMVH